MLHDGARLVVGAAQSTMIALTVLDRGHELLMDSPLASEVYRLYTGAGRERLALKNGAQWRAVAANKQAGRGLSVDHLILDELRSMTSAEKGWSALSKTTNARPRALTVAISNAGDATSVVLNGLQDRGREAAADPDYRGSLGLFEWSAPDGCDLADLDAYRWSMPALGDLVDESVITDALLTDEPATIRTELLCQRVASLSGALDMTAWEACADAAGSLADARGRVAACVDTAADGFTSLAVAAQGRDGVVRVELAGAWASVAEARAGLAELLARIAPRKLGWFSSSPTSALAEDLRRAVGNRLEKLTDPAMACMGLASLVSGRQVRHGSQQVLDEHLSSASRLPKGAGWVFARTGSEPVSAAYAASGAVMLARSLPPPSSARLIVAA